MLRGRFYLSHQQNDSALQKFRQKGAPPCHWTHKCFWEPLVSLAPSRLSALTSRSTHLMMLTSVCEFFLLRRSITTSKNFCTQEAFICRQCVTARCPHNLEFSLSHKATSWLTSSQQTQCHCEINTAATELHVKKTILPLG